MAWRPSATIRVIAIGLVWHDSRLLAAEVLDDNGKIKGVRPLGGGVDFGEIWQTALKREFREELDCDIQIVGPHVVFENIYRHEGRLGHEVVFAAPIELSNRSLYTRTEIQFNEDNGTACVARWFDVAQLNLRNGPQLYPEGLKEHLSA